MRIGILSDSHGRVKTVEKAFALLEGLGVEAFFHCGDVGGQDVLDLFVSRKIWFVWGNMDLPGPGVDEFLKTTGLAVPTVPIRVELAGKSIAMCHGHENAFRRLRSIADCDYLFYGHTHVRADERLGGCRMINPGALHRAQPRTVAALDLSSDELTFHELE